MDTTLIPNRWGRHILYSIKRYALAGLATLCGAAFGTIVGGNGASAQQATNPDVDSWIVTIGGGAESAPSFEGSRRHTINAVGSFDVRRLGEPDEFSAPDDNFDYTVFDLGGLEIGPVVGMREGRSKADDRRLAGVHNITSNLDAGIFMQYWLVEKQLRVRSETRQALWGRDGLVEDLSADWVQPITENLVLSAGPRASFANRAYMRNRFGISSSDAANSDRFKAFDAEAGLKSVGLAAAADYTFSPAWSAQAYVRYDRLTGSAADSPITSGIGTRNQTVVGITLSHSFQLNF